MLTSPAAQLLLLIAVALVFRRFAGPAPAPTPAGSMVMAIGIFVVGALQQFAAAHVLTQPLALALLVLWGVIAASYVGSYLRGTFKEHLASPVRTFALGTWVAGTAVLARVVLFAIPEWRVLAALLGMLAAVLWICFAMLAAKSIPAIAARSFAALVPGVILLSTVSTQSLSLAALDLLPAVPLRQKVAVGLIALGALFYLACGALVVRSHVSVGWTLKDDWDNSNCVIHGAMSITGLALVASGAAPPWVSLALWVYVLFAFVAVEAIEVARLSVRVRAYGWRRGAFTYHVTQWSRNFTFGMFFAFTLALTQHPDAAAMEAGPLEAALNAVIAFGPYVVLLLLVIETVLYLVHRIGRRPVAYSVPPARRS